jgi:hypothetical protein
MGDLSSGGNFDPFCAKDEKESMKIEAIRKTDFIE